MASGKLRDLEAQKNISSPASSGLLEEDLSQSPPNLVENDPVDFEAIPRKDARKRGLKDRDDVWAEYLAESVRRDDDMLEACNKNMDVLLIFAGLFSAVLTAFTVSSYGQLQPDPQARTTAILQQISYQLSVGSGINVTNVNPPVVAFRPSREAIRLNVLWFSSLTCSLLAALGAVFAKQWMVEYPRGASPSATPCERAQHRQVRFNGITTWHFLTVIDFLPFLIQTAFFLFFIGLCDFLFSLNTAVGLVVVVPCSLGFFCILFSLMAAMIYPSCPFRTPLSTLLGKLFKVSVQNCVTFTLGPVEERNNLWHNPTGWQGFVIRGWKRLQYGHPDRVGNVPSWALTTATLAEDKRLDAINAKALAWLLHSVAKEDVVVTIASFIPTLPASDVHTALDEALPRLCTLFQSYFTIDGEMDCLCPKIIPKDGEEEKIKMLGRAIHRIMLQHPVSSPAGRATRVIGDVFGDAFLIFPPRGVGVDIHALVCSLFTADSSYHRRYSLAVQEQLFVSLLKSDRMSQWALTLVLDSLCSYLSTRRQPLQVSREFKHVVLSQLTPILGRPSLSVDLSGAVGLAYKVVLDGTLDSEVLVRGKTENLPQNLLAGAAALMQRLQDRRQTCVEKHLVEDGLSAVFRTIQEFVSDKELEASFRDIRQDRMGLLSQLLLLQHCSLSSTTVTCAVVVLDCYPNDSLPFSPHQVKQLLSNVVAQLRPGIANDDLNSTLHVISRLIDIEGETTELAPLKDPDGVGKLLVSVLRQSEPGCVQLTVLHSLARHAWFWFERSELCSSFEAAGLNDAIIHLLSSPLPDGSLILLLTVADHIAPASSLLLLQADPQLVTLESILKRRDLEPYTRQQCATVMLRVVLHLPEVHRTQVLDGKSELLQLATGILEEDIEIGEYLIEEWSKRCEAIAQTHATELVASGFFDAVLRAAKTHGCGAVARWIPENACELLDLIDGSS